MSVVSRSIALRAALAALTFLAVAAAWTRNAQAWTVTRTSSPLFYIDSGITPSPKGMYASYQISHTAAVPDAWARITSFTGTAVSLGASEDGVFHLGTLAAGVYKPAFFFLTASAAAATAQTHNIEIYDRNPTLPGAVLLNPGVNFSTASVTETIAASANKVTAVVTGPNPASLGGIVTMTVTGDTGTIGAAGIIDFNPAAYIDWPSNKYELYTSRITLPNLAVLTDQLYVAGYAGSNGAYSAEYKFVATGSTSAPAAVSPVNYISSGTQIKHTSTGGFGSLTPIPPASNTTVLSMLTNGVCPYRLTPAGGTVTYTLRLTNSGANDVSVDNFVDTLPSSPASVSYVPGSSTFNGAAIPDPSIVGALLAWNSTFVLPAGQTRDLSFQAVVPGTAGTYSNSAVAHIGNEQIDTTTITTDDSPATCQVVVPARPTVDKAFSAAFMAPGGTVRLTLTLNNGNGFDLTSVSVQDVFPTSPGAMTVAAAPAGSNSCGGTFSPAAGDPSIQLTGGTIAAGSSCTVAVDVTATVAGSYSNTSGGAVSSETAATGLASNAATLDVVLSPSISLSVSPDVVAISGDSVLTVTVANPDPGVTLNNLAFTLNYPASLFNGAVPAVGGTCGGTKSATATTGTSVSLGGANSLAPLGSCTVTVHIASALAGDYTITFPASGLTTAETRTNLAPAVTVLHVLAPVLVSKSFASPAVGVGDVSVLTVALQNTNTRDITGASFTDSYPGTMANAAVPNPAVSGPAGCDVAPTAPDGTSFALSGATVPAGATCTYTVNVASPAAGTLNNSTGGVSTGNAGTGAASSAVLTVSKRATVAKSFGSASVGVGDKNTMTITIANPADNVGSIDGIAFTDSYPAGMVNFTPSGAATTCAGGSVSAADGGGTAVLSGAVSLAPGASCTVTVDVTSAAAALSYSNSVTVNTSNAGSATASGSFAALKKPTATKSFSAPSVGTGDKSTMTVTIANPADNVGTITGLSFTDSYPTDMVNFAPSGAATTCVDGSVAAADGGGTAVLSGTASLAPGESCTVTVDVTSAVAAASHANSVTVDTTNAGSATAAGSLAVLKHPTVAKSFGPSSIGTGGTSTMTVTISNPADNVGTITGLSFTDSYPAGMTNQTPAGGATTCTGGSVSAADGGGTAVLSGTASLAAGSSCTVTVDVTSAVAAAAYANSVTVDSTNAGSATASANLAVLKRPTVTKSFSPSSIGTGGTSAMTVTIGNPADNVGTITGLSFTDSYPAGMTNRTPAGGATTCTGGSVTAADGGGSAVLSGAVSLAAGSSCTVTVDVTSAVAAAAYANSVTVGTSNAGTATATADLAVLKRPTVTKSFSPAVIGAGDKSTMTVTVSNPADNVGSIDGIAFVDSYPAGMTNFAPAGGATTCTGGTVTAADGGGSAALSGTVSLAANSSCTVTVDVTAPVSASPHGNSVTVDSSNAGDTVATADLTVQGTVLTKVFGPTSIVVGAVSTLTFTVTNGADNPAQSGLAFTDTLPAGLTVSGTPSASQCGGTVSSTATGIALSGGSLSSGVSSCTITATVTSVAGAVYTNDTANISGASAGMDTGGASATLTVISGYNASGSVYEDADHNAGRGATESGTGIVLYVKLAPRSGSTCTGPATQAATVDSGTGEYALTGVTSGEYCLVLSTNAVLADVNPVYPSGRLGTEAPAGYRQITMYANNLLGENFGLFNGSRLSGRVFRDDGSGGTANNGVQDGSEAGLANVVVRAANGGTAYDGTVTGGSGDYQLWIPAAAVSAEVVETNPPAHISTGGSVGNSGAASYDRSNDRVSFSPVAGTSYTGINFADVPGNEFVTEGVQFGLPGSVVFYSHSYTARSGGTVSFSTVSAPSPSMSGWSEVLFLDADCNAVLSAGDTQLTGAVTVVAGQTLCLVVKENIPANAPVNAVNKVSVGAAFTYTNAAPALSAQAVRTDLTTVGTASGAGLTLIKSVDKTSALPGDDLTYTITYGNAGSVPLSNIVIRDSVPAFTDSPSSCCVNPSTDCFAPATTAPFPASITACTPDTSGSDVSWTLTGTLSPGNTGRVKFKVRIQP